MTEGTSRSPVMDSLKAQTQGQSRTDQIRECNIVSLHCELEDECPSATAISTLWGPDGSLIVRVEYPGGA